MFTDATGRGYVSHIMKITVVMAITTRNPRSAAAASLPVNTGQNRNAARRRNARKIRAYERETHTWRDAWRGRRSSPALSWAAETELCTEPEPSMPIGRQGRAGCWLPGLGSPHYSRGGVGSSHARCSPRRDGRMVSSKLFLPTLLLFS